MTQSKKVKEGSHRTSRLILFSWVFLSYMNPPLFGEVTLSTAYSTRSDGHLNPIKGSRSKSDASVVRLEREWTETVCRGTRRAKKWFPFLYFILVAVSYDLE